jgi:cytochrome b subunit of formate dehydrogenase
MEQIINWFLTNWVTLLLIIENVILLIGYIVKLTKTEADDNWLLGVIEFLKKLGLYKKE